MPKPRGSKAQVAPEPEDAEPEDAETWVQCDGCNKWRRLPTSVAAALSDDTPW